MAQIVYYFKHILCKQTFNVFFIYNALRIGTEENIIMFLNITNLSNTIIIMAEWSV